MSVGLYGNVGGTARKSSKLYGNICGTNRKLKSLWANVGGVNRKIFSGAIEALLADYSQHLYLGTGSIVNTTDIGYIGVQMHEVHVDFDHDAYASLIFGFVAPSSLASGQNMLTFKGLPLWSINNYSDLHIYVTLGINHFDGAKWNTDSSLQIIDPMTSIDHTFQAPYVITKGTTYYFSLTIGLFTTDNRYNNQPCDCRFPWSGIMWVPTGEKFEFI